MSENGKVPLDKVQKAWDKVFGGETKIEPAGLIPVWDGVDGWRYFRNYAVVTETDDPGAVEAVRVNAVALIQNFPATMEELEKVGVRVRTVLNKAIKNPADVAVWADSIFNVGPSKRYFSLKPPRSPRKPSRAHRSNGTGDGENEAVRPRGRPRKDGLVPGSPEAREADRIKKEVAASVRAAKQAAKQAEPVEKAPARRVLVRVGATVGS